MPDALRSTPRSSPGRRCRSRLSRQHLRRRWPSGSRGCLRTYPWLVAEDGDGFLGYAYATAHRHRPAVPLGGRGVGVRRAAGRRRGVGRALYWPSLLADLSRVRLPSRALAGRRRCRTLPAWRCTRQWGSSGVGVYRGVGYKLGAWHDVGWWQRLWGRDRRPSLRRRCPIRRSAGEHELAGRPPVLQVVVGLGGVANGYRPPISTRSGPVRERAQDLLGAPEELVRVRR